jgi:hypothetical protein
MSILEFIDLIFYMRAGLLSFALACVRACVRALLLRWFLGYHTSSYVAWVPRDIAVPLDYEQSVIESLLHEHHSARGSVQAGDSSLSPHGFRQISPFPSFLLLRVPGNYGALAQS